MQSTCRDVLKHSSNLLLRFGNGPQVRRISLTGAIERGIRKGKREPARTRTDDVAQLQNPRERATTKAKWSAPASSTSERRTRPISAKGQQLDSSASAPHAIPYTQPNSEFIYGTFGVGAAVAARRRELHKLYVYVSDTGIGTSDNEIERNARKAGIEVQRVSGQSWLRLLDKASEGRPHNGYLLEASPLPIPSVTALRPYRSYTVGRSDSAGGFGTRQKGVVDSAAAPTDGDVHAQSTARYPFYLFLDQILDPGNIGAIIRSAYFFGVDGVILLEHNTAPLTGIAVKSSAGASEYLPMLRVRKEVDFIKDSQQNGWRFFGAVPTSQSSSRGKAHDRQSKDLALSALKNNPTVLVLGGEGEGIRPRIARLLDESLTIETAAQHAGIDSLNVSVAASILIRDFLAGQPIHTHSNE